MTCLIGAYVANIIIYNYIFKYLKSHLSILILKKNPGQTNKKTKNILFFLTILNFFFLVFLKTFLSFQTLLPATQQSKTKQITKAS